MFSFFSFLHFLLSYFSTTSKENVMMETGNSENFSLFSLLQLAEIHFGRDVR